MLELKEKYQRVELDGLGYQVVQYGGWYLEDTDCMTNCKIFDKLGWDRSHIEVIAKVFKSCVPDGCFPEFKSLKDLQKYVNFLELVVKNKNERDKKD
jgi:hypothetical protein